MFFLFTYIFCVISLFSREINAVDCDNREEVSEYLNSNSYNSLFSLYANISSQRHDLNYTAAEDTVEISLDINDILPENRSLYLRHRAPGLCGSPTQAIFHVTVLSLDTINESDMTYTLDMWLTIAWVDERLRFPESTRNYRLLDVDWLKDLWKPKVTFTNARKVKFQEHIVPNHMLTILRNKVVAYMTKLTLVLTCTMNFKTFPHDIQVCDMKMESLSDTTTELTFAWDKETPLTFYTKDGKIETPQFESVNNWTKDCVIPYPTGSFACLHVLFHLKRRFGFHFIHTYIPSAAVVILSWITFWMKPQDVAARFGLGVTSLLTLATLSTQSQSALPPVSYAKAIDEWMLSCALFVFCSIVEFAAVNYLVGRFPESADETILKVTEKSNNTLRRLRQRFTNRKIQIIAHNVDRVSRVVFPSCFLLLNVWYWNTYLH